MFAKKEALVVRKFQVKALDVRVSDVYPNARASNRTIQVLERELEGARA